MTLQIHPLHPVFVGEVSGIDLSKPITPGQASQIEAGMDRYGVLVFHDQRITDEQQMDFSRHFGELEVSSQGEMSRPEERRLVTGNTEFADMRAAYDALDAKTKAEIEDLVTEHSIAFSRAELGFDAFPAEHQAKLRPVRHRLVTTHPGSGRKVLYLSAHIGTILGWPVPEARAFIRDLMEHATQPRFVYTHTWRVNDLVMWDNRATMHRARRYGDMAEVRDLRRTTTKCDGPTTEQTLAAE